MHICADDEVHTHTYAYIMHICADHEGAEQQAEAREEHDDREEERDAPRYARYVSQSVS
jgi:hypothetical protein